MGLGWTATIEAGEIDVVNKLFNEAKVDGMIYGYASESTLILQISVQLQRLSKTGPMLTEIM